MSEQRTFNMDPLTDTWSVPVPAAPPPQPIEAEGFARLLMAHPWVIPWLIAFLNRKVRQGAKSVGMREALECCRRRFPKRFGETIEGVGKVGLNNNYQAALTVAVLKRCPALKPYLRVRQR